MPTKDQPLRIWVVIGLALWFFAGPALAAWSDDALSGRLERRVSHILVETQAEAQAILEAIQRNGARRLELFTYYAKTVSKDPGSSGSGGDLDFALDGT